VLFRNYLLPFELASILFLAAMVGAVMLGKREVGERHF
jgi:NADH-quinone oxidoreductase subunit J